MKHILFGLLALSYFISAVGAAASSPVGVWETIDHKTGKPSSYVQMEEHNGILTGRVVKIFAVNGQKQSDVCHHCPPGKDGQPVLGLGIIWDMHCDGAVCKQGRVMDPRDGDVYHAQLAVLDDNKTMHLRGYIGFPLLGRTETWYRVS